MRSVRGPRSATPAVPILVLAAVLVVALPVALAALFVAPSLASAADETSRADVIAQEQAAKARNLGVEGPSRGERTMEWIERSPLVAPTSGFYPLPKSIYPGTSIGVGLGYVRRWPNLAHVDLRAGASANGSWVAAAEIKPPRLASGMASLTFGARYVDARNLSFYGFGPNSSRQGPVRYNYRPASAGVTGHLHLQHWLMLSGAYQWLRVETALRSNGVVPASPEAAPALGDTLTYNVVEGGVFVDWRTSSSYSTSGGFHRLTWTQYFATQSRPFAFHALEYEGIQLVPILREQFVLAGRVLATLAKPKNGDQVPFELAPTLGGTNTLRGFRTRRFTDLNRLLLTGEYRWRPSRYLDMAVFADAGKVAARRQDLDLSNLEFDWGIGARFHSPRYTLFRVELARSREGWVGILAGGKAF